MHSICLRHSNRSNILPFTTKLQSHIWIKAHTHKKAREKSASTEKGERKKTTKIIAKKNNRRRWRESEKKNHEPTVREMQNNKHKKDVCVWHNWVCTWEFSLVRSFVRSVLFFMLIPLCYIYSLFSFSALLQFYHCTYECCGFNFHQVHSISWWSCM